MAGLPGLGRRWRSDDYDPYGEINLELHIPGGIWPIGRCIKRLASALRTRSRHRALPALDVGAAPAQRPRRRSGPPRPAGTSANYCPGVFVAGERLAAGSRAHSQRAGELAGGGEDGQDLVADPAERGPGRGSGW